MIQIGNDHSALLGGKAETASVVMVNSEFFIQLQYRHFLTIFRTSQQAGQEEQGIILVSASPSMLQQYLGSEVVIQITLLSSGLHEASDLDITATKTCL